MKKTNKKLTLNRATVRELGIDELDGAAGGKAGDYTCTGSMCGSCTYQSAKMACSNKCTANAY